MMASRSLVIDALKIGLACMVVGIHTGFLTDVAPRTGLFLTHYLFRIAVPVFFLLNGYYLAGILNDPARFNLWLRRILLLYAIWSLAYLPRFIAPDVQTLVVFLGGYFHLWYLIAAALGAYLLFRVSGRPLPQILAMAGVLYLCGLAIQYMAAYHVPLLERDDALSNVTLYRNFLLFGFPFMAAGYGLARARIAEQLSFGWAAAVALGGLAILALEYIINTGNGIDADFDMLFGLPLACGGLAVLALKTPWTTHHRALSDLSTWIYLSHLWILTGLQAAGIVATLSLTTATIAICIAVAPVVLWLNRRLPLKVL